MPNSPGSSIREQSLTSQPPQSPPTWYRPSPGPSSDLTSKRATLGLKYGVEVGNPWTPPIHRPFALWRHSCRFSSAPSPPQPSPWDSPPAAQRPPSSPAADKLGKQTRSGRSPAIPRPHPRRRSRSGSRVEPRPQNLVDVLHQPSRRPRRQFRRSPGFTAPASASPNPPTAGANWKYVSEADIPVPQPDYTLWAPEVIDTGGTYHMFLTVVPGTFTDWNHPPATSSTLTSKDLLHWTPLGITPTSNPKEPSMPASSNCPTETGASGTRIEADSSKVYFSDSPDLVHWNPQGHRHHQPRRRPGRFLQWHGACTFINDPHAGLGVFRSDDLTTPASAAQQSPPRTRHATQPITL